MYRKIFLKVMGYHTLKYRIYILWPVFGHHLLYFSILFGSNARLLELWKKYFQFFLQFFLYNSLWGHPLHHLHFGNLPHIVINFLL